MQHRMLREAQKAMAPWMNGQPIYAPISSNASSQGVPILYSGERHKGTIRLHLWCFVESNRWLYVWVGFRSRAHTQIKHVKTNLMMKLFYANLFYSHWFRFKQSENVWLLRVFHLLVNVTSPKGDCCEYTVKKKKSHYYWMFANKFDL